MVFERISEEIEDLLHPSNDDLRGDFICQKDNWILRKVILQDNDESFGIRSTGEGSGDVKG